MSEPAPMTAPGRSVLRAPNHTGADPDGPQVQFVTVDPISRQVDLGLDRASIVEPQHSCHRRQRVEDHVLPHTGPPKARAKYGTHAAPDR